MTPTEFETASKRLLAEADTFTNSEGRKAGGICAVISKKRQCMGFGCMGYNDSYGW
jgi:hypothetical protein